MAISVFILNRLRLWAVKRHSLLSSRNLFRAFTFRLALIPVWNEQNQPSFYQSFYHYLPVIRFASKDSSDSKSPSEPKPNQLLKQPNENGSKKNLLKDPPTNEFAKEAPKTPTAEIPKEIPKTPTPEIPKEIPKIPTPDDLSIKEISGDLPKAARKKKFRDSADDSPPRRDEMLTESQKYIPLMSFPEVIWPGLWNLCKNLYAIHFVIHVKIDPQFNPREFLEGAREAIAQISKVLAEGKLDELKGFVTDDAIDLIRPNLIKMNVSQRHHLEMALQDIYVGFIDVVEVIIDTQTTPNKKFVEISCCFHSLRDLMNFKKMYPDTTFYNVMDHKDRISIGNYRFRRDYTEGSAQSGHWMVSKLNHFQPLDLPQYS